MLILLASIAKRLIGNYELRMDELINKQDIRWQLQETAYILPKQQGASFPEVSHTTKVIVVVVSSISCRRFCIHLAVYLSLTWQPICKCLS